MLEIDANPNVLRTLTSAAISEVRDGAVSLGDEPGLGTPPDPRVLAEFAVPH